MDVSMQGLLGTATKTTSRWRSEFIEYDDGANCIQMNVIRTYSNNNINKHFAHYISCTCACAFTHDDKYKYVAPIIPTFEAIGNRFVLDHSRCAIIQTQPFFLYDGRLIEEWDLNYDKRLEASIFGLVYGVQ